MTPYQQLVEYIIANGGILKQDPVIDGKWHNIPTQDGSPGNKSFGYIAFQNKDGSIGGKIKNYYVQDEGESFIFTEKNNTSLTPHTAARTRQQRAQDQQQQAAEHARASGKAQYVYAILPPAPAEHPYLARKQIEPHMAKVNQSGQLVIPMINAEGKIQSLEFIGDNGFKKIMPGSKAAGAFTPLGFPRNHSPQQILIAEGFATAASLYESTGIPTIHARGKGNMLAVTEIMQMRHSTAQIIIAADNDRNKTHNAGLNSARNIQNKHPAVAIMLPPISGDYNDLAVQPNGRARIRAQFADIDRNQYITESKAEQLLSAGRYDILLRAAQSDNIDLTPALARKMTESPNTDFSNAIMRIALRDQAPQVREAAAAVLARGNEGAPVPNYQDVSMSDVQKIRYDASPVSSFAAQQTALDKQGIDLPDNISTLISSWRQEIHDRRNELGLSEQQSNKLTEMFAQRIITNKNNELTTPQERTKQPQHEKDIVHER